MESWGARLTWVDCNAYVLYLTMREWCFSVAVVQLVAEDVTVTLVTQETELTVQVN